MALMMMMESTHGFVQFVSICLFLQLTCCHATLHINTVNQTLKYRDIQAGFGSQILMTAYVRGYAVEAYPKDACSTMSPAPNQTIGDVSYYFAVAVSSSKCSDDRKTWNAQSANFAGIIIYDPNSVHPVEPHRDIHSTYDLKIFVVGVGEDAGSSLLTYNYKTKSEVRIYGNIYIPLQWYLLPFITIVGVCLLLMLFFLLFKFLRDRRRTQKSRLSQNNLKKLPVKKYKKGDEYDLCAICLDEYEDGDKLRLLPCSHAYHCKCVDPWLTNNKRVCPICKRRVTPSGENASDSEESHDSDHEHNSETERTPLLGGANRLTVPVETRATGTSSTHRSIDAVINSV